MESLKPQPLIAMQKSMVSKYFQTSIESIRMIMKCSEIRTVFRHWQCVVNELIKLMIFDTSQFVQAELQLYTAYRNIYSPHCSMSYAISVHGMHSQFVIQSIAMQFNSQMQNKAVYHD